MHRSPRVVWSPQQPAIASVIDDHGCKVIAEWANEAFKWDGPRRMNLVSLFFASTTESADSLPSHMKTRLRPGRKHADFFYFLTSTLPKSQQRIFYDEFVELTVLCFQKLMQNTSNNTLWVQFQEVPKENYKMIWNRIAVFEQDRIYMWKLNTIWLSFLHWIS